MIKSKKSNLSFDKIVAFTIVLIVIVVVIILVIKYFRTPVSTPNCEKDYNGICEHSAQICIQTKGNLYTAVKGYGCPEKNPYCCLPINATS